MLRRLIASAVLHPVTTTMVTVAVLLFGLVALTRLPVELLPDLSYPTITVETTFPDAAPAEVEELITRPVEERVGAVPGVVRVESSSREGTSEVVLDFAWGTSIDTAMAEVREKLDRVELPIGATRPLVLRYDPSQEPIMRLSLRDLGAGNQLERSDLAILRDAADRTVKRELEKLPGVAAVELHGGEEEEVLVELDPAKLAAHGIDSSVVVDALRRDNINRPGGAVTEQESRFLIRTLHEARTPAELEEVIVRTQGEAELRLRDIAKVHRAQKDREEITSVDGREAVELAVFREGDANIVAVAEAVKAALPRLPLAPGHEVIVLSNRAEFVESAIEEVKDNTLLGGALAVLVLLFFLRDLRSTIVIALAIPISLLATFVPLQLLGVSLNVMSLGGLALGVGMLVDNSIVVLEAISRARERGEAEGDPRPRRELVVAGASEVASSVVASTLTTVAVFLPMAFVEGVAGQLVEDLSYTVSLSILSSMVVSLTLVPVLQTVGTDAEQPDRPADPAPRSFVIIVVTWPLAWLFRIVGFVIGAGGFVLGVLARPFTWGYDRLESTYAPIIRAALRVRIGVILGGAALCVACLYAVRESPRTLLPELDQGEVFVQVALPRGASLERTAEAMEAMSAAIADAPEVEHRFIRVGSVTTAGSATGSTAGVHLGQLSVRLHPGATDRAAVEARLLDRIRAANPEPEAVLQQGRPSLITFAPPIEVLVFSEDPDAAAEHAKRLLPDLAAVEGLIDVAPDDLEGRPEVRVDFDRERLGRLGLTVDDAALAVQRAVQGEVATTLYASDRQLEVRVLLPRADRSSVEDVERIHVGVSNGIPVRLAAVANVEPSTGPSEIRRLDGRRGLRISAHTVGVDLGGIAQRVQAVLDEHAGDADVTAQVGGQAEEMQASLESLMLTVALSVFLVYVVMASSFESLGHPFLILFTMPMALAGVALSLWLTRVPISAMVGIGVVVLGGIVVNNAIVLVNAVNDRRGAGMAVPDALADAGRVRLRPIVMTTATTVLGVVPMAMGLGDGAALRQPLAITIIGGLTLSTLLTLVVIPCAYSLFPGRVRAAWRARSFSEPLLQGTAAVPPLSTRLRAVAELVLRDRAMADIGTDHARLPAWLLGTGRVPRAIASDIGEGPLEEARRQLAGAPVELRRGDGLGVLEPGEIGTVVIAGMGADTIRSIVDGSPEVAAELERLVLQPNTGWVAMREWIAKHRWTLEDEVMVEDRGKFYVVFAVRPQAGENPGWDALDLELGPILRKRKGEVWRAWIDAERERVSAAMAEIERHGDPSSDAASALRSRRALLDGAVA
jgi:HAE1 family hydrophobic/amphiphilic exporter-1